MEIDLAKFVHLNPEKIFKIRDKTHPKMHGKFEKNINIFDYATPLLSAS